MNKETGWQMVALTVLIACGAMFGWCYADILSKVETGEIYWNPPMKAELYRCIVYTLLVAAAALKLDIPVVGGLIGNATKSLLGKKPDV